MRNKLFVMLCVVLMATMLCSVASAAELQEEYKVKPGEIFHVNYSVTPNAWITLQLLDSHNNIVYFDSALSDAAGNFNYDLLIAENYSLPLKLTVGFGKIYHSANLVLASDEPVVLTVYDGSSLVKEFTQRDIDNMQQFTNTYSTYNTYPTYKTYSDITGVEVIELLRLAGLSPEDDKEITFRATDDFQTSLRIGDLIAERYYFGQNGNKGSQVPVVIGSNDKRLYIGQLTAQEQTDQAFVKNVSRIVVGNTVGQWGESTADPASGATVQKDDPIRLALPSGSDNAKLYYTLDGSEPTVGSAMYNKTADSFLGGKEHDPIPAPSNDEFVITTRIIGLGKMDGNVVKFTYNSSVTKTYTVAFDSNGGSAVDSQPIVNGGKVTKPADPTRADYTFDGWYKNEALTEAWDFDNDTVSANNVLYAKWTPTSGEVTYIVTFNSNGGTDVASQSVSSGGKVTKPADPTRTGYTFTGWYKEAALTNVWNFDNDTINTDFTLYARWTATGGGGRGRGTVSTGSSSDSTTEDVGSGEVPLAQVPASPEASKDCPFTDITGHWAHDFISDLWQKGMVNGTGDNEFQPDQMITRAEFVKMLASAFGQNTTVLKAANFTDVEEGSWYEGPVNWAAANDIVTGYGNGQFGPQDPASRQDIAAIVARFCDTMGIELTATANRVDFADDDAISAYAREAVYTLQQCGVVQGAENGEFKPFDNITRAEVAKIIYLLSQLNK